MALSPSGAGGGDGVSCLFWNLCLSPPVLPPTPSGSKPRRRERDRHLRKMHTPSLSHSCSHVHPRAHARTHAHTQTLAGLSFSVSISITTLPSGLAKVGVFLGYAVYSVRINHPKPSSGAFEETQETEPALCGVARRTAWELVIGVSRLGLQAVSSAFV